MDIVLRTEEPRDYYKVEILTREAFWDVYKPGCDEHYLVHILRKSDAFIRELSIVADIGDQIAGHVLLSRAIVLDNFESRHEVLCLGPISVHPDKQHAGFGTILMRYAIQAATALGYRGILLFGDPRFYARFGFVNAQKFGITTSDGKNFDAFMALELAPGSLNGISGKFFYDELFDILPDDADRFDTRFPRRERHVTDTQLNL